MTLDRDELAARFAVADLSNPNFATDFTDAKEVARWAAGLKGLADALLAALVPVAPASGAPATEPYRGADCLNMIGAVIDYYGQAFIVTSHGCSQLLGHPRSLACGHATPSAITFSRWATREECERHGIPYVARPLPGAPLAAPSPEPAAWVPSVGDVVHGLYCDDTLARITYVAPDGKSGRATGLAAWCKVPDSEVGFPSTLRRATSSERAAAGLPVDESAFDEAKEREAAKVAVSRDAGDDFTRGWLARARVAAKGGA